MKGTPKSLQEAITNGFECPHRPNAWTCDEARMLAHVKDFVRQKFSVSYMRANSYTPEIAVALITELERLAKEIQIRPADAWIQAIKDDLRDGSDGVGA